MGISKAIYVKDDDLELWRRAERFARKRRLNMSALALLAIEEYLNAHDDDQDA